MWVHFKKRNSLFGVCFLCVYMVCCSYVISICVLLCTIHAYVIVCCTDRVIHLPSSVWDLQSVTTGSRALPHIHVPYQLQRGQNWEKGYGLSLPHAGRLSSSLPTIPSLLLLSHSEKDETETLSFGALNPGNVQTVACRTNMSLLWV